MITGVTNVQKKYPISTHLKFVIPSLIGVLLFITPIKVEDGFTIPIGILAGMIEDLLANYLSLIMMLIIVMTAILTVIIKLGGNKYKRFPFINNLFQVNIFWTITRIIAAVFAVMVYYQLGTEAIYSEDTGDLLLGGLLHTLFAVFLFAGLFLPLLMDFGLLDLFGTLMTKIMRPLFRLPGRASVDSLASWVGDGTIGVLLTSKQYEEGHYTKRESVIIGTTFSVVSITFTLVIIETVGLEHMFIPFYLTVIIAGLVAALIMPRIPPLSLVPNTYMDDAEAQEDEEVPECYNLLSYGYKKALDRAENSPSFFNFFKKGLQNVLDMWMGVAPIVMAFGLIALIFAEFTPLFEWLGMPFIPLLELMQVPYAKEASETILIGFADMFLPAVIGAAIESDMTRFIIAVLSVTQLIYMSEVGGVLLGSKVPVKFIDLVFVFLLRTLITLPIIVGIAHLLF